MEWTTTKIPEDFMSNPEKYGEKANGGAADAELKTYDEVPHFGIVVIERSA